MIESGDFGEKLFYDQVKAVSKMKVKRMVQAILTNEDGETVKWLRKKDNYWQLTVE